MHSSMGTTTQKLADAWDVENAGRAGCCEAVMPVLANGHDDFMSGFGHAVPNQKALLHLCANHQRIGVRLRRLEQLTRNESRT